MTTHHRVGLPPGFSVPGALRRGLWRSVFHVVGGFRVTGAAPYEAMVVVSNHQSHADTPALIAAFPTPYRPVVVAADDYWFDDKWKSWLLRVGIGAVPVRRKGAGGYDSLIEGARQVLGSGSSLLVFPEGTRSRSGRLGHFHTGALRLAKEFDVPVLPVAVVGTYDLFPKGGKFSLGHPVEVRVGSVIQPEDLDVTDPTPVKEQIAALLAEGPARPMQSGTWKTMHRFMDSPWGLVGAAAWGMAEAISWPVAQEVYLAAVAVASPKRMPKAAAALAAGSVAGVAVTTLAARAGHRPPAPFTTERMRETAAEHLTAGASGIWRQALNGIPIKVYAAEAGAKKLPLASVLTHAAGSRAVRAAAVGAAVGVAGVKLQPVLKRFFGPYVTALGAAWGAGELGLLHHWRDRTPGA